MNRIAVILIGLLLVAIGVNACLSMGADAPQKAGNDKDNAADNGGLARSSPQDKGDTNPVFWGHLTEDQENEAVEQLKTFAQKSADTLKHPLHLDETKFFLFYSDLPAIESSRYAALLERMYAKMNELFGLEKGHNVWRGKSLVFAFARIEDYRLYERMIENNDPGASFAMTHCFGDGMVHTAFFRYADQAQFEHLLVHESVHGFLHRYRSPGRVPSWANEGLADEAASEVIPDKFRVRMMTGLARSGLEKHKYSVGDFFTARHIDGWQYPIAETLAGWMIHQNRDGYLDFINGIKDGQAWEESLKKNFKMPPEKLLGEYGKSVGVKGIRM